MNSCKILSWVMLLAAVLSLPGCATVFCTTCQRPEVIYPATRLDIMSISMVWAGTLSRFEAACLTPVAILDCPVSIITDTVMLPYDLMRSK